MNIAQLHEEFLCGERTPLELLDEIYEGIDNDDINDFITLSKNLAYEEAEMSTARYQKKKPHSLLDGIPVGIKDNFAVKNLRMTCGSKILENFISPYNATVVERIRNAGGLIIGKTNMDEFAMGSSTENSYFGTTLNPVNRDYVPGGSSGGSAAAVASGHCTVAIGSDTGGSVRQPASFCNTVGFKPSYGTVSRFGLTAFSSSLDTVGMLAETVSDAEILFDSVRGPDRYDSTLIENIEKHEISEPVIGYLEDMQDLDSDYAALYRERIDMLKERGFTVKPVNIEYFEHSIAVYQILSMGEASSNLARYDGIKYGYQIDRAESLFDVYSTVRGEGFGKEVKRRIMTGTYFLSNDEGKYYQSSCRIRNQLVQQTAELFSDTDFLIIPTTLNPPFRIGERVDNPLQMHLSDSLTAFCNLANLPSVSIPAGVCRDLPVGMQVIGGRYRDLEVLDFAGKTEKLWSQS